MGFQLTDIPAAPSGSRFYLGQTAAGNATDPAFNVGASFLSLIAARRAAMQPLAPAPITVALKLAVKEGGEWVLRDRGFVTAVPSLAGRRPGKLGQTKLRGGELLDSFGLGGEGWEKATDAEVFEALRAVCETHDLEGDAWRLLNDSVCRLIVLRAGAFVSEEALPHPSPMRRRAAA